MTRKKIVANRNPRTGSYTVPVPKSTGTGEFVSEPRMPPRIVISAREKQTLIAPQEKSQHNFSKDRCTSPADCGRDQ